MFRRGILAQTFALALVAAAATPARADFALSLGVKWLPVNYTHPISASMGGANGPTAVPLTGWQTTSLDNNFGAFFLGGRLGFQISLDVGYGSANKSVTGGNVDLSYSQFGFSVGAKYYILPPHGGRVSPYVLLDFFKYFASVSTNDKSVPDDQASYIAGLVSPLGIDAAIGAEYFFTPSFSLGAEVLGLKFAYSEGDYSLAGGFGGNTKVTTTNEYVTFYTGITLNYRFALSGSVHVKEQEGGEEPTPVRKVTPPPKQAPPSKNDSRNNKDQEPPPENPEEVD
jgi:hypothetical protein